MGGGNTFSMLRVLNDCYKVGMLNNSYYSAIHSPVDLDPERAQRNKLSPYRAYYLATLGGAKALYLDKWLGNFDPDKEADFIVLDLSDGPSEQSWLVSNANMPFGKPEVKPTAEQIKGRSFPTTKHECAMALLAVIAVGDSRAIEETWVNGKKVYEQQTKPTLQPAVPTKTAK